MPIALQRLMGLMMRSETATSLALAAGVIAQSLLLWVRSDLGLRESVELCAVSVALVIATVELWRLRQHLNPHVDMLLIMFSIGGAGMAFSLPAGVSCHTVGWPEWLEMSGFMIGAGLLPSLVYSRCLREARREKRLCTTMAFDSVGMLGGMKLAGFISTASSGAWAAIASHTFMVIGMMAGMIAGMALLRTGPYRWRAMTNVALRVTAVPLSFLARMVRLKVWNPHM
jgi:hypothetical protein